MADDIDRAQDHIEREEAMRRKYSNPNKLEVEATGECLNCFEPLPIGMRWCDNFCKEDWEKRRK